MRVIDYLVLISSLQTLVIFVVLFFYKSKKVHINRYLGLFFATLFVELVMHMLNIVIEHPAIHYQPLRFDFLSMNFLFFYAVETSGICIKRKLYYYIPGIIEFLFLSIFFVTLLINPTIYTTLQQIHLNTIIRIIASIYIITFSVMIIKVNIEHKKKLFHFYEITKFKSLNWLTVFCVVCILFNIVSHTFRIFFNQEYISIIFEITYLFALYYLTIASLVQINIVNVTSSNADKKETIAELENAIRIIDDYMLETKAYLNPSITLKMLSKNVKLPERLISKAINKIEHKNFNNYINYYRIEEFKKLLSMDRHKKFSISAIANEVGFNSRASFYKNFKDIVGVSPSSYAKNTSS